MGRLTAATLVSALIRRVNQEGGTAAVLARGDATAGAILWLFYEKGTNPRFYERGTGADGRAALLPAGPAELSDEGAVTAYWRRRTAQDRDLWVVELDIAQAQRFAAETIGLD